MKEELLVNYESRIQFIQFELDDILEELTREEEEPEEPEPGKKPWKQKIYYVNNKYCIT